LELVTISIAAGIGEELLVRGWLMGWIIGPGGAADPWTIVAAVLVSSVAFGLMHPISVAYTVIAALMGLVFAGLLLWSGNLLVPISAHATYDAIHLVISKRQMEREKLHPKAVREEQPEE
jgi:membrane protease YdiL (CAAX protease family)